MRYLGGAIIGALFGVALIGFIFICISSPLLGIIIACAFGGIIVVI